MEDILIRDAKLDDTLEMVHVRQNVWETTYRGIYDDEIIDHFDYEKNIKSFRDKILNPKMIFKVAVTNNKIVGYLCFGNLNRKYKNFDYGIKYLHILKDYQGHGIGRRFFKVILEYIKENNIDKFYVSCNKYNSRAHKYYEKMGGIKDHIDDDKPNKKEAQVIYIWKGMI